MFTRIYFTVAANLGAAAYSASAAMVRKGSTIIVNPPRTLESVVVITHGLGDSAEGFADVAQMFSSQMPNTRFVLPTAPNSPVTLNGGYRMPSWYDIAGLQDRSSERCEGIVESAEALRDILASAHEEGIPYSRMALAGFSQGGALSLYSGLQMPQEQKLAGILVMSGYLAGARHFKLTPGLEGTPVLHQHGTSDPMVQFKWAEQSRDALVAMGMTDYTLEPYQGMEHTVIPQELRRGLSFLQNILAKKRDVPDPGQSRSATAIDAMSIAELKDAIALSGLGSKAVGLLERSDLVALLKEKGEL